MYQPCTCNGHVVETDPKRVNFYNMNFVPRGWELEYYDSLASKDSPPRLYLTGYCKDCHGDLRERITLPETSTEDALLEEIYRAIQFDHPYDKRSTEAKPFYYGSCKSRSAWYHHRDELPLIERNKQFIDLFHDYDRPRVRRWLEEHTPTPAYEEVLRDTGGELFCKVIELARENGDMDRVTPILDYILPNEREENRGERVELTRYEFDFFATVQFGGSEGIYVDCYLKGKFDESGRYSLHVGTLKTLGTGLEDCKAMAELCGALMYHENRYVNGNIHRYTPERELLAEKRRLEEKMKSGEEEQDGGRKPD